MNLKQKLFYFIGTIKRSVFLISAIIVASGVGYWVLCKSCNDNSSRNTQITAFFVGIIASIIATLVLKIFDNYLLSKQAHHNIIEKTNIFIIRTKKYCNEINENNKLNIFEIYYEICTDSIQLSYKKDFAKLSSVMNDILVMINTNSNVKKMKAKICELEDILYSF